ncbi:hypothetical protein D3C87_1719930 [compost metagenome]
MKVSITPARIDADVSDIEELGTVARLNGAVHEINRRTAILGVVAHRREMENPVSRELPEGLNQGFLNRVELVGLRRERSKGDLIGQPVILEICRFEYGSGRVGVVFQQLCRAMPVIGKIEAAIQVAVAPPPRISNDIMVIAGDGKTG